MTEIRLSAHVYHRQCQTVQVFSYQQVVFIVTLSWSFDVLIEQ